MANWDQVILADGPTAWYKFNAGSYADAVAGGSAGTAVGTIAQVPSLTNDRTANAALDFGNNARVTIPAQTKYNVLNNFSIELLVQFDVVVPGAGYRPLVQKVNSAATYSWGVGTVDGAIGGWVANSAGTWSCVTDIVPVPNRVYHVVMTYNSINEIIVFVDGEQRGARKMTSGTFSADWNGIMSIGADWTSPVYLDGKMDEVLFWNRPLEAKEAAEHHIAARDNAWGDHMFDRLSKQMLRDLPLSWTRFTGGTSLDMMGGGGATLVNGATIVSSPKAMQGYPNKVVDSLSLDGVNDYATLPGQVKLDTANWGWTASFWMRPSAVTGTRTLLHRAGDFTIKMVNGVLQATTTTANGPFTAVATNTFANPAGGPNNPFAANQGYHVMVAWRHHTFWGSNLYLYVNGIEIGNIVTNGDPLAVDSDLTYIGALTGTSEFFAGQIAEVAFWDKALGIQRVVDHFWMGLGLEDPPRRPFDVTADEMVALSIDPGFKPLLGQFDTRTFYETSWDSRVILGIPASTLGTAQAVYKNNADPAVDCDIQMYAFPPSITGTDVGRMYFHLNHDGEFAGTDGQWWGRNGYTLWIERLSTGVVQGSVHRHSSFSDTVIGAATPITVPWVVDPGYLVRFQKRGKVLRWKIWATNTPEPGPWNQTITDNEPLGAGHWGFGASSTSGAHQNYQFDYMRIHADRRSHLTSVGGVLKELTQTWIYPNGFGVPTEYPLMETYPDPYPGRETPPYVRDSTQAVGNGVATLVVNKPVCYPGDILYLFGVSDDQVITGITGATWQELYTGVAAATSLNGTKVYRRIVDGNEPATFTMTMALGCDNAAVCVAVAGAELETPEAAGYQAVDGNNASPIAPGNDPLWGNGLLLGAWFMRDDATPDTFTKPASMTLAQAAMSTWASVAVASEPLPDANPDGTPFADRTATRSSSAPWRGLSLVVRAKRGLPEPRVPVTGLVARWVASDLNLADGAAVPNSWVDRISGKVLLTDRPDTTARPTYRKSSLVNGKPAVRLDGVNDTLYNAASGLTTLAQSVGIIFRPAVVNVLQELVQFGPRELLLNSNGTVGAWAGTAQINGTAALTVAPHAAVLSSPATGAESVYVDGRSHVSGEAGTVTGNNGALEIGSYSGNTARRFNGDIAEVFIWDHQVNIYEIMDFMRYAEATYGVAL